MLSSYSEDYLYEACWNIEKGVKIFDVWIYDADFNFVLIIIWLKHQDKHPIDWLNDLYLTGETLRVVGSRVRENIFDWPSPQIKSWYFLAFP